jgi:hypothetical protein
LKLARYWTRATAEANSSRGKRISAVARGWSDESIDAARTLALEIAQRVADRIASGQLTKKRYPYGDRPLPEPVLRTFQGDADGSAVVTRNAYGALVLNADRMMFVDVDRKETASGGGSLRSIFAPLFGKPKAEQPPASDGIMEKIGEVVQRHGLAARVYETKAGYRVLITSTPYAAGSPQAKALLTEFGSDPLYIRLCGLQTCFRARLTPKPWRCRMIDPPVAFPFETLADQQRIDRWQAEYDRRCASYATCTFIAAVGNGSVASGFAPLIQYHDETTKSGSDLALA